MESRPERYDAVIVGGGPAGCVLAARLSEDRARRVLLLEAGPDYGPDPGAWPPELCHAFSIQPDSHSWGFFNARPSAGQPFALPRARVLGGSSTINACVWLRGSRADYDAWAAAGNPGWGFADLLPYFVRAENDPLGPSPLHGTNGPVPVYRAPEEALTPVDHAFIAAAAALGFDVVADHNGSEVQFPGIGPSPKNIAGGVRMNATFTYLAMARGRPNLEIRPDTLIDRVLLRDGRATAVVAADGRVFAGREIILCAGAYASPAILLRSGIGPAGQLREQGIRVVHDLPGVGEHLLDHPIVPSWALRFEVRPAWAPAAPSFGPLTLKARSRQCDEEIDLHAYPFQSLDTTRQVANLEVAVSLQVARSRGWVRLASPDPTVPPLIDHNYFADARDLAALTDGAELITRLAATPPLAEALEPASPVWRTREELTAFVAANVGTTYHPSSTCRMGPASDPLAVVDQAGRVHGLRGLRVADASIFPSGPRCNLHFPIVAVAEKLADTIRRETV